MTDTALIPYQDIERMGAAMAKSGLFGIKTPEQAIALMLIAQAEGKHPAIVARDFDIIQGRPSKKSEAMLRDFLAGGGKIEWHAMTDALADATFSHPAGGSLRVTWDMDRAKRAELGGKDMWRKYPRQMLRARVISEGVRAVGPFATSGLYVPEEVRDFEPSKGTTVDAEPANTANPRGELGNGTDPKVYMGTADRMRAVMEADVEEDQICMNVLDLHDELRIQHDLYVGASDCLAASERSAWKKYVKLAQAKQAAEPPALNGR